MTRARWSLPVTFLVAALGVAVLGSLFAGGGGPEGLAPRPEEAVAGSPTPRMVPWMVIVQPGYPGSTREAEDFMAALTAYVGKKVGLPDLSGAYYNDEATALSVIAEKRPSFGIVSLGFYLKHRKYMGLRALCASKPKDNFVILARPKDVKGLGDLAGHPVAGGPLYEPEYLGRVVLREEADVGAWKAAPTNTNTLALRQLSRKERGGAGGQGGTYKYRAVIITGREYRTVRELPSTQALEKVFESDYYPPALLVLLGKPAAEAGAKERDAEGAVPGWKEPGGKVAKEEVEKLVRTFRDFPRDAEGKQILEQMGAEGFEEVQAGWLESLEGRYDAASEKKSEERGEESGEKK